MNYENGFATLQSAALTDAAGAYCVQASPTASRADTAAGAAAPAASVAEVPAAEAQKVEEADNYITVKSPIIGTFYRKPSPDKHVFAEVGQQINEGDVLCVIEAMKLFNEIESEVSGKIVKVLVDDSSPVEFEQPLFLIDPS